MKNLNFGILVFGVLLFVQTTFGASFAELESAFDQGIQNPRYQMSAENLARMGVGLQEDFAQYEEGHLVNSEKIRDWALELFNDGRVQEGIWVLDHLGLFGEAELFSQALEKSLADGPVVKGAPVGRGVTESSWATVNKTPVLVKPKEKGIWNGSDAAEVLSYHLDRILGLNMVVTAVGVFMNEIPYSIHIALKDFENSGIRFIGNYDKAEVGANYPEMFVLDFLIKNLDRHGGNSLTGPLGFLVAIDNGRSAHLGDYKDLSLMNWRYISEYSLKKLPRREILHTIAGIDLEVFKSEFARFAPQEVVMKVAANLAILKHDFLKMVPDPQPLRPIRASERLLRREAAQDQAAAVRANLRNLADESEHLKNQNKGVACQRVLSAIWYFMK